MKPQNLVLSLCFLLFSSFTAFAQQPSQTPPVDDDDSIKISTNLIQLDVTVTDKNGNTITDLKPEDFEVYENGVKQTLTNFSFVSVDKKTAQTNSQTNSPTAKTDKKSVPLPPVRLKAEQVRRTYALVVDDLGLSHNNVFFVKQSLKKFVNEQMQDGDLVAIIRTGSGIGATQSFTADKRQLLAAVEKIKWNAYGRSGIGTFEPITTSAKEDVEGLVRTDINGVRTEKKPVGDGQDKQNERNDLEFRNDNFTVGTLGALNYVVRGMRDLPGRKAVVLFSEGFLMTSNGKPTRILEGMRVLADLANRSSVVIYTIDPRGLQVSGMANSDDQVRNIIPMGFDPRTYKDARTQRDADFQDSQQSLRYLAYETGGIPYTNQNNIDKGLLQAVSDQSSYYLLGYQPDDATFDPKKNKFNKLEIKLTRPDLQVRYRSGFFGVTDEKIRDAPRTPEQRILNALTSPFGANDVRLNLYPVFQNEAGTGDVIQALIYINAKDLQFTKTAAGKEKMVLDIRAMTFGDNGMQVDQFSKVIAMEVEKKVYQSMLEKGFVYALPVPVKKSGAYQFRIALRDLTSDKIGSASQFIEVPDVKKNMAISNLLLDNFTAAELEAAKRNAPVENGERSPLLDTTDRQYKRGSVLRYYYAIYNPDQNRQLESQMRLIKDGKVVYEENAEPVKTDAQPDLNRLQAAGAFSLGKNLETGSYVLQVIVSDKTNAKKFATQFVEFEIVE